MAKRLGPLLLMPIAIAASLWVASANAAADTGQVSPQYQGYSTTAGADPYANSPDVHVGGYGGQPVVNGYIKLNLDSLPAESTVEGLQLTVVANTSGTDNVN